MELILAAKSTKPGSKAASRGKSVGRVPSGTLHYVDTDAQSPLDSMFTATCGEGQLVFVSDNLDDEFPNDYCAVCADARWAADFNEMQKGLLK